MTTENEVPSEPNKDDARKAREIRKNFSGTTMDGYAMALLEEQVLKALSALRASWEKEKEALNAQGAYFANQKMNLEAEKKGLEERVRELELSIDTLSASRERHAENAGRLKAENVELRKTEDAVLGWTHPNFKWYADKIDTLTHALAEARELSLHLIHRISAEGGHGFPVHELARKLEDCLNNQTGQRASEEMMGLRAIASDVKILLDEHGQSEAHIKYGCLGCEILNKVKALEAYERRGKV